MSWSGRYAATNDWLGPLAIVLACLCWAVDNNLTRRISASDALFVAGAKGAMAGAVNVGLAFALGASLPAGPVLLGTLAVGLLGYCISLVLFVLALRGLGTARTGTRCWSISTRTFRTYTTAIHIEDGSASLPMQSPRWRAAA